MIKKTGKVIEFIDWIGVVLTLVAYSAGVLGFVSATSYGYLVTNVVASVCIAYGSWKKRDVQPMTLNIIWALIALIGIVRALYG